MWPKLKTKSSSNINGYLKYFNKIIPVLLSPTAGVISFTDPLALKKTIIKINFIQTSFFQYDFETD